MRVRREAWEGAVVVVSTGAVRCSSGESDSDITNGDSCEI